MHVLTDSKTLSSKWKATIRAAPRFLRLNAYRGDKIQLTMSVENRYYTKEEYQWLPAAKKKGLQVKQKGQKGKGRGKKAPHKGKKTFQ